MFSGIEQTPSIAEKNLLRRQTKREVFFAHKSTKRMFEPKFVRVLVSREDFLVFLIEDIDVGSTTVPENNWYDFVGTKSKTNKPFAIEQRNRREMNVFQNQFVENRFLDWSRRHIAEILKISFSQREKNFSSAKIENKKQSNEPSLWHRQRRMSATFRFVKSQN